jgi:uncharacterized membrane protein
MRSRLWLYLVLIASSAMGTFAVRAEFSRAHGLNKLIVCGRLAFAVPLAVFGTEHLVRARTVMLVVPAWMPGRLFWTYFVGVALIAAALSIIVKRHLLLSSTLLAIMFFLFVALMHIPFVVAHPRDRVGWTIAFRDITFAGGALALAGTQTQRWRRQGKHSFTTSARYLILVPAIFFGVEHFLHPELTPGIPLRLVTPTWFPGRLALAYLTGVVLLVAGASLLINNKSRLAATGLGLMILFCVVFMYLPITVSAPSDITGLNYLADTLLLGGAALVLAAAMPHPVVGAVNDVDQTASAAPTRT